MFTFDIDFNNSASKCDIVNSPPVKCRHLELYSVRYWAIYPTWYFPHYSFSAFLHSFIVYSLRSIFINWCTQINTIKTASSVEWALTSPRGMMCPYNTQLSKHFAPVYEVETILWKFNVNWMMTVTHILRCGGMSANRCFQVGTFNKQFKLQQLSVWQMMLSLMINYVDTQSLLIWELMTIIYCRISSRFSHLNLVNCHITNVKHKPLLQ